MKQFSKFKQFADKAFVRPDRTEVMSEDLLEAERHIDLMKLTCETTVKKMGAFVQGSGQNRDETTIARRIKKVPEWALGSSMDELGKKYEEGSVLGKILGEAGQIEMTIGTRMTAHEGKIEPIMAELQKLVDTEFPAIYKLKRNLAKQAENMDTAKNKLQQANNRHSMSTSTGGKIENFKDDLDESQVKVEQCRDNLAAEMYQLLSKETDIAKSIVQFLKCQQEYHQVISNTLSTLLPEVELTLANATNKPVYGTDLAEHLAATGRTIAYPLEYCVCCLLETGIKEEGLFRVAGSASKVKKIKSAFNVCILDLKGMMAEFSDPHVIGNALKCYLRELPNPLLTLELYGDWIDAIRVSDNQEKLQALWNVVQKLPQANRENLRYLIKFLRKLSDHQDVNKMSSPNIAIVLGPNLLWSPPSSDDLSGDSTPMGLNMAMTHWFSSIVEQLVTYADWFFPGDIEFYVTCEKPEPEWVSVNLRHLPPSSGTMSASLPNGSSTEDILDDNQALKRSQSNSSLDENTATHNGSPKPVIRRKVKPAPLPPTSKSSSETMSAHHYELPKPSQAQTMQPQRPPPVDSSKPLASTKREGMWIPPSPSQMNSSNRASYVPPQPSAHPPAPKAVPPKPPQPTFLKEKTGSTESPAAAASVLGVTASTTLRHKTSFRSPSKGDSKEGAETGGGGQYISASLPRRFHTENSYKNTPMNVKDVFSVKPDVVKGSPTDTSPPQSKSPEKNVSEGSINEGAIKTPEPEKIQIHKGNDEMKISKFETKVSKVETKVSKEEPKDTKPEGGEKISLIELDNVSSPSEKGHGKSMGTTATVQEPIRVPTNPATTPSESSRPVPAPRASLQREVNPEPKILPGVTGLTKERPCVKAKPRDLGQRAHGEIQPFPTHCRNSSGSGAESEGEVMSSEGKPHSSSQPHSRTHSRTDSLAESSDLIGGNQKEGRSSIPSEDEGGSEPHGNGSKNSPRMPYRPPRPHPPAPPKGKGSGEPLVSTDL